MIREPIMKSKTAYLAVNGNDETAALNKRSKPYATYAAALAALEPFRATHIVNVVDVGFVQPTN